MHSGPAGSARLVSWAGVYHRHQQRAVLAAAATDVALVGIAFAGAYWTRSTLPMREFTLSPSENMLLLAAAAVAVVATGRAAGVYSGMYSATYTQTILLTVKQTLVAAPALLAFLYLLNLEVPVSRLFLALFFAYLGGLQFPQRLFSKRFRGTIRRALGTETSVLVIGDGERAIGMAREVEASERHGLRLLGIVDCGDQMGSTVKLARHHSVRSLASFPRMLRSEAIDEVLVAVSSERIRSLEDVFLLCDEHGIKTRVAADLFPHVHSRVHLDWLGDRPLLTFSIGPADDFQLLVKRCLDLAITSVGLIFLSVPMALVALLVKVTSKGPVLFRQQRCGLNGNLFTCYKFRSMVEDAEARRHALERLNEKDGPAFKIRNDPRLTPIGAFLRRFSIDEWPQFWNVLRGEMSIVGPRPAIPSEVSQYEVWQRRRLRMRPGLTCLWAIRGRDELDFESWMQMDLEYIDNWSLLLDLRILLLTIPVVLAGKGAN